MEEISVEEKLKELRREQKRLKKKAKRIEKCKHRELVEEEHAKPFESKDGDESTIQNGGFEDIDVKGHEGSCEDDDDRDSVDTPCSCEDMHCARNRRETTWAKTKNNECSYVGKPWPTAEHSSTNDVSLRDEEGVCCSDCLSASSSNSNGAGKKKKGRKKKKRGSKTGNICDKVNRNCLQ